MVREGSTMSADLQAGAGRAEIQFGSGVFPIDGFTATLDPLAARVLVLVAGERQLVLVVVDQTSVPPDLLAALRQEVAQEIRVTADDVLVISSHTFSAPHLFENPGMTPSAVERVRRGRQFLVAAAVAAAAEARGSIRPARAFGGSGTTFVAVNRDVETSAGWWLGVNGLGPTDPWVGVIRIETLDGSVIAVIANHAVQSSVMNGARGTDGGLLVSDDLAGHAMRLVENQFPGSVAMFLPGAAGDQAPLLTAVRSVMELDGNAEQRDAGANGQLLAMLLGERLGGEIIRVVARLGEQRKQLTDGTDLLDGSRALGVIRSTVEVPTQEAPTSFRALRPTRFPRFVSVGTELIPVTGIRLGSTLILGVQPELTVNTGVGLRQASPAPRTLVATMVDGAAKYMADELAYERGTYEAMNSRFARGSAELVAQSLAELAATLWG
jgi:hypothetical protein